MKFGIIGAGMIGGFHAQAIAAMQGGTLGGVADRASERATAFAVQYSTKAYDSVDAMLADPEIEVVTIGTPSGAHFDPAMAAIEAGKHVIIEKPLEVTTERIDQMIAAAKAKGVTLAAVLNRRFHPGMDAFKKAADAGRFGKLTNASAYVKWYRDQAYYDSAGWRGTWALDGGGALMNQSIHTIDALLYLAGPVKSVQANTACLAHVDIEVEDIAVAILEFESGARGIIEGSTCTWSKDGHPARVQLAGTEGSVFLADEAFEIWDFMHETEADESIRAQFMQGADAGLGANDPTAISFYQHQRNFEEVVNAIQAGREPSTGAAEARKSVELIQAIYQSAQNDGTKITLR
ncbi:MULTISPECIES: Gfo/Idh/MocA family protein [unclassified Lentimonas]|uniref:Gfo/Idh/MocA family protein n=1 Tax=unclassified Lentimonas TaxID=2630993 RepID=UPI0013270922|nr:MULTISPECIES: Gfo/Idh/MocA family oxidoreductase [unclassified Lentimonas]CAA6678558.1 Myo-inositol 2-dehydrogenase (EC [Lentimonas sp. CC4]CAA6685790.1 Myo-inositol 2-dehydrogenase (EC [Lentimonas sp. CC6]CAA7076264.1 Myo-inositol 2-dehydrogenase (EC [Lentimonas sp. CC4]CAA7171930.1 Myo-inositol 2-dehydrogenase (EC [Lentimonas sp. CC21]CAA7181518.1 Myo-inositol 2-dehydrogenase (EC [Lentimonas sp. CC8]